MAALALLNVPVGHPVQVLEPTTELYEPGTQFKHVEEEVAPIVLLYVPTGHPVQFA